MAGILLCVSVLITGKYFGASTTFVRSAGQVEKIFSADRVAKMDYFVKTKVRIDWQWMFVVGIFFGSLISTKIYRDYKTTAVPPMWEKRFGSNNVFPTDDGRTGLAIHDFMKLPGKIPVGSWFIFNNFKEKRRHEMLKELFNTRWVIPGALCVCLIALGAAYAGDAVKSSYSRVVITEPFEDTMARMKAAKPKVMKRQMDLLNERYDLDNRPAKGVMMSGGEKPVQEGVRAKLPKGMTWEKLARMTPEEMRKKDLWPIGFLPLPHPNHPEGGMVFPQFHIDEIKKQEGRDLTRFDLDLDLPDHLLPEFPSPIYLTTRPDLGDVSQGKIVTMMNYYEMFNGILNPKQLEGLRLLVTAFPQQQFNQTEDRRSELPSRGVTCFDCHLNGHTNGATHLVGDIRPQEFRHRLDIPTLRGVNIQRLFGSQRALKSIEDFTEFEQRAAYFDGDPVIATKKGVNVLERGSQAHFMAEFQALLDFPPAPKLNIYGKLCPKKATESELRGEEIFSGKAQCAVCHPAPYYTDNLMHNLKTERFFKPRMVNGRMAASDGPIKTFPLRGIKDSPPYLHDGRLLTLEDTVEFFNLVQELKLTEKEKKDLVNFMRAL